MSPELTVVVMSFNEEANLPAVIDDIRKKLAVLTVHHEILIVDDGSTDGTPYIASRLQEADTRIRCVTHTPNRGLGEVYRTGFEQAKGTLVTFLPADGQFPASNLIRMYAAMGGNDAVFGNIPQRPDGRFASLLSTAERSLYRLAVGNTPRFQGLFMVRRSALADLRFVSGGGRGWGIVMELVLLLHRGGYRLCEVTAEVRPRLSGKSKVNNVRTIWANLRQLLVIGRATRRRERTSRSVRPIR
jgi:glycosyltransferase involved in cell wall biosynthesis